MGHPERRPSSTGDKRQEYDPQVEANQAWSEKLDDIFSTPLVPREKTAIRSYLNKNKEDPMKNLLLDEINNENFALQDIFLHLGKRETDRSVLIKGLGFLSKSYTSMSANAAEEEREQLKRQFLKKQDISKKDSRAIQHTGNALGLAAHALALNQELDRSFIDNDNINIHAREVSKNIPLPNIIKKIAVENLQRVQDIKQEEELNRQNVDLSLVTPLDQLVSNSMLPESLKGKNLIDIVENIRNELIKYWRDKSLNVFDEKSPQSVKAELDVLREIVKNMKTTYQFERTLVDALTEISKDIDGLANPWTKEYLTATVSRQNMIKKYSKLSDRLGEFITNVFSELQKP